ncbi:MAG: thioredoxin domain-containing protein [Candidatus Pacebacteria bacterium]|jgi:protein-disulfide isomerase|nr:thioredoxin domain-containing protein [Candidatus Paceibacterota bacterium]MBT3511561.1 thioredoxin domain-containing protein [Candidatus Paceibacterota bacterium]MBT4004969.1 thioredoxin domain-containing protein [Candidatus Paceibacterota bacterium]MBT4358745.1 thioredoxin domain-containing protein [Candidatus Paceibacterota bacterium]MBT4680920.1 thioredoxin domain-containing protein [Candidatus Paceibacterota bacterium]
MSSDRFLTSNLGTILLAIVFFVSGFFVGTLWTENKMLKLGGGPSQKQAGQLAEAPTEAQAPDTLSEMPEISDEDHIIGAKNPKIYLVEYSDYECPFCERFHPTTKQIIEKYGDDVALVFRHYPLGFHPNAQSAAEAAECVANRSGNDAFWKYTDEIFSQNEQLGGKLSPEAIDAAIAASGANTAAVKGCLESGEMTEVVTAQQNGGAAAGVSGTPGTILLTVDGESELISGALPLVQVEQIIEKYL